MGLWTFHTAPFQVLIFFPSCLSSLQLQRKSHISKPCEFERVYVVFFFFFFPSCFPLQSYFESVLPLFPPPGLFRLVLAHLRAEHLHLDLMSRGCGTAGTCRLHGHPWVRTSFSIPGARYPLRQSPTAVLAIGVSPKKGSQSQEGLAGC